MPSTKAKTKTKAKAAAPAKAVTAKPKRKAVKKTASAPLTRSLVTIQPSDNQPFFEFKVTQQTLYWVILGVVSIAFATWVLALDSKVQKLYDEIDASTYSADYEMPAKPAAKPAEAPAENQ